MKYLSFFLISFIVSITLQAQEITGDWYGVLEVQGQKIRVVYHISKDGDNLKSTMDSPDQGVMGIPMANTTFSQDTLTISAPNMMMKYSAVLKNGELTGEYHQSGMQIPLQLTQEEQEINRPQVPKKPYPYLKEEVTFENIKDTVNLAGTLTKPKEVKNFPTVILISGSGPQNRNEEVMGHQPFLVISDYLTRNGIAVLRYDDRGVGKSTGNFSTSNIYDFTEDAKAAVNYLRSRKDIDASKIVLLGHSEGGVVAPLIASKDKDLGGIILLAAPGVRGDELLLQQQEDVLGGSGMPKAKVDSIVNLNKGIYEILNTVEKKHLNNKIEEYAKKKALSTSEISKQKAQFKNEWLYSFLTYDPTNALQQVTCPVLALNGSKDIQVNAAQNLQAIEKNIAQGGNKNVTVKELENLNHLFQTATTGMPNEYGQIEETISPKVLEIIKDWIHANF
ncbi:alpha/beta hydrolase family protein [Mesonia ostreae]|uniref:Alpha/beta fold hydrolase n=1 Tax=Mesonia ostreae TaxID=861110 RepID=A0ABU2KF47_9FLAO|nr:alpha/beta fold hydrolase [Mesonia ostreae]MDT0293327.1 alpha/beta fold hydrolase [Mesonia ostreae]